MSTGNLGDNIIEEGSFYEGVKRQIDCFAADAGTADAGPTFLGADMPHNPIEWEEHDLELLLVESRKRNVPMIVGSCSTTGTDKTVDRYADIIRRLAKTRVGALQNGLDILSGQQGGAAKKAQGYRTSRGSTNLPKKS